MSEWHFDKDVADIKELLGVEDESQEKEAAASAEPEAPAKEPASEDDFLFEGDDLLSESDEGLSEEERAVKESFREKRREEYNRAKVMVRAFRIGVPVLLIALMIWSFSLMAGNRLDKFIASGTELIEGFAQMWYGDWTFEDGEKVESAHVSLDSYLSYNREAHQQYKGQGVSDGGVFAAKGSTCFVDCEVTHKDGEQFTLVVHYYEAEGDLDQADWDELQQAGPQEATYIVTVDQSTNRISKIEAA